jgi:DHA1 family vesicular acetylcholine transporter-like MFS transporter 3
MSREYPQHQWLLAMSGLALEGVSCFMIPFCTNYWAIMIPISGICFGIALVDTAILPTLGYLVDVRHTSVYGSIYAIADISYSLAYAVGPVIAGNLLHSFGFSFLNFGICFSNLLYAPVIYFLRYFYEFKPLESNELNALSNQQSTIGGAGFKRFTNDDSEFDQPIQHGFGGNPNYSGNNNNNTNEYSSMENQGFNNGGYYNGQMNGQQQQQFHQQQRPDSAQFQGMQKYPKKATKNPYKDTKNLIDNMDEDDY